MLGDDACAEGMAFVEFPRGDRFDGDAGQTEFVDVVAQHGIFSYSVAEPKGTYTPKPTVRLSLTLYAP